MEESESEELTLDGSVDFKGRPAIRAKSGRWGAGIIILCKLHKDKITELFLVYVLFYILEFSNVS
jgi:hypothetical protein